MTDPTSLRYRGIRSLLPAAAGFVYLAVGLTWGALGATYHVSMQGNDTNAGTAASPWRTIQKAANVMVAGDTVLVSPGNYAEYVRTRAHGMSSAPVTFRASPANDPDNQVIATQFRVQHRFNVIEGFNLTGAQDVSIATIRVEFNPPSVDGSHTVVTNNTFRDGVYLMSDDLHFSSASNSITSWKESWLAHGFAPGGYVFLGSNSKNPYQNHDTAWRVKQVSERTIYLTNTAGTAFVEEPSSNVWGVIYAGNGNNGCPGIDIVPGPGISAATNCTIAGNTFSNLFGCPIKFRGENHLVENNFITRIHGYYGMQPAGRSHLIRNNLFKDCTNFIFFTQHEMANIPHPAGGNFFDYQVAFISSFVSESTDIIFERNWLENIHNQLALISHAEGSRGFTIRSNVFVGVQTHMSGSQSGLVIENNTFYRCSYDEGRSVVLGLGGVRGVAQEGLSVQRNLFIDCGCHYSLDYEGFYGLTDSTNYITDFNFVCGPEMVGYAGKRYFLEAHGVNGGDPVLRDPTNPLGPDGRPFTEDDGLRPLASSAFGSRPWGALRAYTPPAGVPVAHFRVVSPVGWFDKIGTNFNPNWVHLAPYQRGDVIRPYTTAESVGAAPVKVVFSATNSLHGLDIQSPTSAGIVSYEWDFGNGNAVVTSHPTATNLYTWPGNFSVSLTVSNALGKTARISRAFRVLQPDVYRPSPPSNLRTNSSAGN